MRFLISNKLEKSNWKKILGFRNMQEKLENGVFSFCKSSWLWCLMKNINGSKKIPVAKTIQVQDGINCKKHKKWSYWYVKLLSTEKSLDPMKKFQLWKGKVYTLTNQIAKGQLISKGLFGVFLEPKNERKISALKI